MSNTTTHDYQKHYDGTLHRHFRAQLNAVRSAVEQWKGSATLYFSIDYICEWAKSNWKTGRMPAEANLETFDRSIREVLSQVTPDALKITLLVGKRNQEPKATFYVKVREGFKNPKLIPEDEEEKPPQTLAGPEAQPAANFQQNLDIQLDYRELKSDHKHLQEKYEALREELKELQKEKKEIDAEFGELALENQEYERAIEKMKEEIEKQGDGLSGLLSGNSGIGQILLPMLTGKLLNMDDKHISGLLQGISGGQQPGADSVPDNQGGLIQDAPENVPEGKEKQYQAAGIIRDWLIAVEGEDEFGNIVEILQLIQKNPVILKDVHNATKVMADRAEKHDKQEPQ